MNTRLLLAFGLVWVATLAGAYMLGLRWRTDATRVVPDSPVRFVESAPLPADGVDSADTEAMRAELDTLRAERGEWQQRALKQLVKEVSSQPEVEETVAPEQDPDADLAARYPVLAAEYEYTPRALNSLLKQRKSLPEEQQPGVSSYGEHVQNLSKDEIAPLVDSILADIDEALLNPGTEDEAGIARVLGILAFRHGYDEALDRLQDPRMLTLNTNWATGFARDEAHTPEAYRYLEWVEANHANENIAREAGEALDGWQKTVKVRSSTSKAELEVSSATQSARFRSPLDLAH
ncbi:MAG: hypothetical protein AAB353_09305 [Candidatus Hydrogenedentota bacterium]